MPVSDEQARRAFEDDTNAILLKYLHAPLTPETIEAIQKEIRVAAQRLNLATWPGTRPPFVRPETLSDLVFADGFHEIVERTTAGMLEATLTAIRDTQAARASGAPRTGTGCLVLAFAGVAIAVLLASGDPGRRSEAPVTDDARHAEAARRAGEDLKRMEREARAAFPEGDVQQTYLAVLAARALATGYGREWVCSNPQGSREWVESVLGRASQFIAALCGDSLSVRLTWRDGPTPPATAGGASGRPT